MKFIDMCYRAVYVKGGHHETFLKGFMFDIFYIFNKLTLCRMVRLPGGNMLFSLLMVTSFFWFESC